mgnify:CR=1 FL=1
MELLIKFDVVVGVIVGVVVGIVGGVFVVVGGVVL